MIDNTHAQAICYNADRRYSSYVSSALVNELLRFDIGKQFDRFWGWDAVELLTISQALYAFVLNYGPPFILA